MKHHARRALPLFVLLFFSLAVTARMIPVLAQETDALRAAEAAQIPAVAPTPPQWFPRSAREAAQHMERARIERRIAPRGGGGFSVDTFLDTPDATVGDGLCADSANACSLRAAVMEANFDTELDSIYLSAGTYYLSRTSSTDDAALWDDLDITSSVGIYGPEDGESIISGAPDAVSAGATRVFQILPNGYLYLGSLTITDGNTGSGAAIYNAGSAYLFGVEITGNNATSFGAVSNRGLMYMSSSAIFNNISQGSSGGIDNYSASAALYIDNTTIHNNEAQGVDGRGGGLWADDDSYVSLYHVTITGNTASRGGGLMIEAEAGFEALVEISNSVIAENTATTGPDCDGTVDSDGWNFLGNNGSCLAFTGYGDIAPVGSETLDPLLGSLGNNGGGVSSRLPDLSSPLRDSAYNTDCAYSDVRGVLRPQDGDYDGYRYCDIGAVEAALPLTLNTPAAGGTVYGYPEAYFSWTETPGATKYTVQVRGVGNTYILNTPVTPAAECDGTFCDLYIEMPGLPNNAVFEWRVKAKTAGGSAKAMWQQFTSSIPGNPYHISPQDVTSVTDTTPTLSWYDVYATRHTLRIFDTAGVLLYSYKFTATSGVMLDDICYYTCGVDLSSLGITLEVGKTYRWSVEARSTLLGTTYKSRSDQWTFRVITPPTRGDDGWFAPPTGQDAPGLDGVRGIN